MKLRGLHIYLFPRLQSLISMLISKRLLFFTMIGVVGFLVDTFFLYLLKGEMGLYFGRLISFLIAAYVTWVLNRRITFGDCNSELDKKKELVIYLVLMACGGSVSYAIYAGLITFSPFAFQYPILAIGIGGLGGLIVNFLTSNLLFKS